MQDVTLADLDRREPEVAHHLAEDDGAGDDHRRALWLEAGNPAPLGKRQRGQPLELSLDRGAAEPGPCNAVAVVLDEAEVEGGERGDGARDGDPAPAACLGHLSASSRARCGRRARRARPRSGGSVREEALGQAHAAERRR